MNLPNFLSLVRLCLIPVFTTLYFSSLENAHLLAGAVFLAAAATDALDGYIARRFNQITRLGRFLDPLADKLMVFSALVCVTVDRLIPIWVAAVYAGKEVIMAVGGLLFYKQTKEVPASNFLGKAATTLLVAAIAVVILFEDLAYGVKMGLIVTALLLTVSALVVYARRTVKDARRQSPEKD